MASSSEFERFTALVDKALSVPKAELDRRLLEHRVKSLQNPVRSGPKIDRAAALAKLKAKG
jgi:hypothetical protein